MADIQQKIDLENLKHESILNFYKDDMTAPPKRKTIPLLQFMFLPKEKKDSINKLIEKEKRHEKFMKLSFEHEKKIRKYSYKQSRYDIYFRKKDNLVKNPYPSTQAPEPISEPIFHHDHTAGYSWFRHPIKSFKKWQWRTFEKETVILINMQLENGKHISFIRPIDSGKFSIFGDTYIVDLKCAYFSLSAGMFCLDYHQSFCIPVKRVWPAAGLKESIEKSGIIDCPAATNPSNITRFLESNIVEQIFQGAALGKMLIIIMVIGIACILAVIICTFVLNGRIDAVLKAVGK